MAFWKEQDCRDGRDGGGRGESHTFSFKIFLLVIYLPGLLNRYVTVMHINEVHCESPQHMFQFHSLAIIKNSSQKHLRGRKVQSYRMQSSAEGSQGRAWYRNHGEMLFADSIMLSSHSCKAVDHLLRNSAAHSRLSSPISIKNQDSLLQTCPQLKITMGAQHSIIIWYLIMFVE